MESLIQLLNNTPFVRVSSLLMIISNFIIIKFHILTLMGTIIARLYIER